MTVIVSGSRVAPHFIALVDEEGLRHVVRQGAILSLSDMDECQDATVAQLPGGRAVTIRAPLEEVLGWFS